MIWELPHLHQNSNVITPCVCMVYALHISLKQYTLQKTLGLNWKECCRKKWQLLIPRFALLCTFTSVLPALLGPRQVSSYCKALTMKLNLTKWQLLLDAKKTLWQKLQLHTTASDPNFDPLSKLWIWLCMVQGRADVYDPVEQRIIIETENFPRWKIFASN